MRARTPEGRRSDRGGATLAPVPEGRLLRCRVAECPAAVNRAVRHRTFRSLGCPNPPSTKPQERTPTLRSERAAGARHSSGHKDHDRQNRDATHGLYTASCVAAQSARSRCAAVAQRAVPLAQWLLTLTLHLAPCSLLHTTR